MSVDKSKRTRWTRIKADKVNKVDEDKVDKDKVEFLVPASGPF